MFDHMTNLDWVQLGFMLGLLMLLVHTDKKYLDEQDKVESRDELIDTLLRSLLGKQWCLTCDLPAELEHFEQEDTHVRLGSGVTGH